MVNTFGKSLGYVRRHNKTLLHHLLKNYVKRGGMYENFGQTTLRLMNETIDKHLSSKINYQDKSLMYRENRQIINYFIESLTSVGIQQCQLYLKESKLYDDKSCYHWRQYNYY